MALPLYQKLRISEGMVLRPINAPANFVMQLGGLPAGVRVLPSTDKYSQIHWFVTDQKQLEIEVASVMALLKPEVVCWVYYPKASSKIQTDLTRDKGWEVLLQYDNFQWLSLISFDDTWSSFGLRMKNAGDKRMATKTTGQEIFDYVEAATKTVRLPDDLQIALEKNPLATVFFQTLSFTNKKEYVEWVVTAKRAETRNERIAGTVERLEKGWKNPRNL